MNVAFPTLILFLVLLPGFLLRNGLKRAERSSIDFSPFGQVVASAVLWAIAAHLAWIALASCLFARVFEPGVLMQLLSSVPASQTKAAQEVGAQFGWIAAYFVSLFVASTVLPMFARNAISKYRLDRADWRWSSIFRFHDAPWYYLLRGVDFAPDEAPDLVFISAIVEVAKEAVLYVGVLDDFHFDADGQLDRLILQNVSRRPLANDKSSIAENKERFYPIDGDYFVLRYSEAVTLNVQYVKLLREPTQEEIPTT